MKRRLISVFLIFVLFTVFITWTAASDVTEPQGDGVVIAAAYAADGRLEMVKSCTADEMPDIEAGGGSVRIFRWKTIESCEPLSDVQEPSAAPSINVSPEPTATPSATSDPTSQPEQTSEPTEQPSAEPKETGDMPGGKVGAALQRAVDEGILSFYEDGTIKADAPVIRADMADVIVRIMGVRDNDEPYLADVEEDAWYREAAQKAVSVGAMSTDSAGCFEPEKEITCEESYEIMAKLFQFESYTLHYKSGRIEYATKADPAVLDVFEDKDTVSQSMTDYAAAVVGNGGFKGFEGQLKGSSRITRGELAVLLDDLIGTYIDEPGTYIGDDISETGSVLVRCGGVVIDSALIERNLIVAYSVDESGFKAVNTDIGLVAAIMGGADTKRDADDLKSYVSLSGRVHDVRVCAPYIFVDLSGVKITKGDYIKTCRNSKANLGFTG